MVVRIEAVSRPEADRNGFPHCLPKVMYAANECKGLFIQLKCTFPVDTPKCVKNKMRHHFRLLIYTIKRSTVR